MFNLCAAHLRTALEDFEDQLFHSENTNNPKSSSVIQVPTKTDQQLVQMKCCPTKLVELLPMMSESEALQCINNIKGHWANIRALMLELKERRGWEALGYPNLTACLEAEFSESRTKLVRELRAAEIEKEILQVPIGTCPASHFRPLSQLKPEQYKLALDKAQALAGGQKLTAALVTQAVKQIINSTELQKPVETSKFQLGELVWIKCQSKVLPIQKVWDGCWGIVQSTSWCVLVLIGCKEVEYQAGHLKQNNKADALFLDTCKRIMALWQTELESIEQMVLKELQRRPVFTDLELQIITCMEARRSR
ncbi:MAG: hypothetical protein JOZ78_16660 [Chroococcidiopsidaceae cyanobacterium CP_BM_ER_R8_30]|nr:hypothetical protein [Chroococcidiopsidaceae cyanobacterium CP_BM_ER_R8_30]